MGDCRPCLTYHPTPVPSECRLCYLYLHDARYRKMWCGDSAATEPPSVLAQAWNALSAAGRVVGAVVRNEAVTVSEAEQERRLGICRACDKFQNDRCLLCGCFTNLKAKIATEQCPMNPPKW